MARNALTQWLHETDPARFMVWGEREWMLAPVRLGADPTPILLMHLLELRERPERLAPDASDRRFLTADWLSERARIPSLMVGFVKGPVNDSTLLDVFERRDMHGRFVDARASVTGGEFRRRFFPGAGGAGKPINVSSSNAFHEWQRRVMPTDIDFQDLDVVVAESTTGAVKPIALLEHKQSFKDPPAWNEADYMSRDASNYASLMALARRAGLDVFAVYQKKGPAVTAKTRIGLFRIKEVAGSRVSRSARYVEASALLDWPRCISGM